MEPSANREALIEGEPDEGAHFSWASSMPNSSDGLQSSGVTQIKTSDEHDHVRGARMVPNVDVASLGGVSEERRVPERWGGAPMPFPRIIGKVVYKTSFENPKSRGFFVWGGQLFGHLESRLGSFLG